MKVHYERIMMCSCGFELKQTTSRLPLDSTGNKMALNHEQHFRNKLECRGRVNHTAWVIVHSAYKKYSIGERGNGLNDR